MDSKAAINRLRVLNFAFGIMENQQEDPVCRRCLSFAKTLEALRDDFMKFEKEFSPLRKDLPDEFAELFTGLYAKLSMISPPGNSVGQKKLGACALGEVCLPKAGRVVLDRLAG